MNIKLFPILLFILIINKVNSQTNFAITDLKMNGHFAMVNKNNALYFAQNFPAKDTLHPGILYFIKRNLATMQITKVRIAGDSSAAYYSQDNSTPIFTFNENKIFLAYIHYHLLTPYNSINSSKSVFEIHLVCYDTNLNIIIPDKIIWQSDTNSLKQGKGIENLTYWHKQLILEYIFRPLNDYNLDFSQLLVLDTLGNAIDDKIIGSPATAYPSPTGGGQVAANNPIFLKNKVIFRGWGLLNDNDKIQYAVLDTNLNRADSFWRIDTTVIANNNFSDTAEIRQIWNGADIINDSLFLTRSIAKLIKNGHKYGFNMSVIKENTNSQDHSYNKVIVFPSFDINENKQFSWAYDDVKYNPNDNRIYTSFQSDNIDPTTQQQYGYYLLYCLDTGLNMLWHKELYINHKTAFTARSLCVPENKEGIFFSFENAISTTNIDSIFTPIGSYIYGIVKLRYIS